MVDARQLCARPRPRRHPRRQGHPARRSRPAQADRSRRRLPRTPRAARPGPPRDHPPPGRAVAARGLREPRRRPGRAGPRRLPAGRPPARRRHPRRRPRRAAQAVRGRSRRRPRARPARPGLPQRRRRPPQHRHPRPAPGRRRALRGNVTVAGADYAAGDRLVFLKNDHQGREVTNLGRAKGQATGVKNGTLESEHGNRWRWAVG